MDLKYFDQQGERLVNRLALEEYVKLIEKIVDVCERLEDEPKPVDKSDDYWEGYRDGAWGLFIRLSNNG